MIRKYSLILLCFFLLTVQLFSAQKNMVFFGSFNYDQNKDGIFVYELDAASGKMTKKSSLKGILNPSFLTVSNDGQYLYACTESKTKNGGKVSSFRYHEDTGMLTWINSQGSGGENPVYLSVNDEQTYLINGNYSGGSVSVYPISADGSIQPMIQNFVYTDKSEDEGRQQSSHIHGAVFSSDQKFALFPDLGADKIRVYRFNADNSKPLSAGEIPDVLTVPGSGPRHLTFYENNAYLIDEMGGSVTAYTFNDGKLMQFQRIAAHKSKAENEYESSDIHVSPDGKFLYASNRGDENNIAIFSRAPDGTLEQIAYQSVKGRHTRVFAIAPDGDFLITANTQSGNAVVFRRNKITGLLKKTGRKIKIPHVSCVVIRKYG